MDLTPPKKPEPVSDLKPYDFTPGAHHIFKDIYTFFGNNITSSVAVYIGVTDWKQDLQLLESYSLPTIVCDPFDSQPEWRNALKEKKGKLIDWMKYLKESNCGNHFVNPKWIESVVEYPGIYNGTLGEEPNTTKMTSWENLLNRANALRTNVSGSNDPHFAICKIELSGEEIPILSSLLATKYRPSLLYVRWSESPDDSQMHCEAAGHLQSSGYRLISINPTGFFLYQYSGQDIYSCCSWINISMGHPFVNLMKDQVTETLKLIINKKEEKDAQNS
jgi:hypothetical protein